MLAVARDLGPFQGASVCGLAARTGRFMSASSTFTDVSRAGPGRPDFPGRPGINALRHDLVHHVTQDVFDAFHKANRALGLEAHEDALAQFGFTGIANSWTNVPP